MKVSCVLPMVAWATAVQVQTHRTLMQNGILMWMY